jgi:topoisomerase-4 subunit A
VSALPGARGDGIPITTLIDLASGSRILHYFAGNAEQTLLLASTAGYGFTAKVGDMIGRMKAGKAFMTLENGDEPLPPALVAADASAVACLSEKGRLLVFGLAEIKSLASGGRGVTLMELEENEKLLAIKAISQKGLKLSGVGRGGKPQEVQLSAGSLVLHLGKRARKGKVLESKIKASEIHRL